MTIQTFTWKLELELSGVGSGWTDVTGDVSLVDGPIVYSNGMNSISLIDLLAAPGDINWVFDNAPSNSAKKYGYYSPGHANCRSGFAKNIRVRYSETYSGTPYTENIYWLQKITPSAGTFGEAVTRCRATDILELYMNVPMPVVPVQTTKRGDELITTLLAGVTDQPYATDLDTGDSTFNRAFDTDDVDSDTVYTVLSRIAKSEYGRIYITSGGTLKFEHRNARLGNVTSLGTISDTMDDAIAIDDAGQVFDKFKVSITPRKLGTSLDVVAELNYHIPLGPTEERTFSIPYVEQTSGTRISAFNISAPVAGTDYKFGSIDDGTTNDLIANLSLTLVGGIYGANSSTFTVKNNGTTSGYLNLFQLQGYGIFPYNTYTVEKGSGGKRVQTLDMPYQDNPNVADAVCSYLQTVSSDNTRRGVRVSFEANKSAALMTASMTGTISTRWTIVESQTAMSGDFFINGRKNTITLGNVKTTEWMMAPAGSAAAWVLGTSALDTNTMLAV